MAPDSGIGHLQALRRNGLVLIPYKPFERVSPHYARGADGARYEIVSAEHQFRYSKEGREVSIFFEWIVNPDGLVLYLDSSHGFEAFDRPAAYEVLARIAGALKVLGFRTETEGDLPHGSPKKDA